MSSFERFSEPTLFILISLAEGNKHGYAIMEDIENSYDIKIGPGTLYGAISRIEKLNFIESFRQKTEGNLIKLLLKAANIYKKN